MKKENRGITLVALIITIIVLLILAVVSIQAVTGTGLFSKTSDAVEKYQNSTEKENSIMDNHIDIIDNFLNKSKNESIVKNYVYTKDASMSIKVIINSNKITITMGESTWLENVDLIDITESKNITNEDGDTVTIDSTYKKFLDSDTDEYYISDSCVYVPMHGGSEYVCLVAE